MKTRSKSPSSSRNPLSSLARRTTPPPISWLMKLALDRPQLISLAVGFTDNETLPLPETRQILEEILCSPGSGRAALQYGTTAGDPELRDLTARTVQQLDRTGQAEGTCTAERTIITSGSQQLLYLATEALCDPGDIVLVEDPTYFVYLGIVQSRGLECRGIPLTADGLDIDRLEAVLESLRRSGDLKRVKMLYLVSYFQNPSGVTTSLARKKAALALLRRYEKHAGHPLYLLEDAAYRQLRFAGEDVPSALRVDPGGNRVIYAGTYSKPFATGARVGFGLLPEPVYTAVLRLKGNHDFGSANLLQRLVARALATGLYQSHLGALQARYAGKARTLQEALRAQAPESLQWIEPKGGLYVWAQLPRRLKTGPRSALFQAALKREVLFVPGELCYAPDPTRRRPTHEMRLSFGGATEGAIQEGITRLGGVLRDFVT